MGLIKRHLPLDAARADMKDWVDPEFAREYPSIMAFLKDTTYADGSSRLPGTISLFVKGGCLTFAVNDNDRGGSAFVNCHTVNEALDVIEQGILNDSLDWKLKKPANVKGPIPF